MKAAGETQEWHKSGCNRKVSEGEGVVREEGVGGLFQIPNLGLGLNSTRIMIYRLDIVGVGRGGVCHP